MIKSCTSCCAFSRRAFARSSRMLRLALSSMKILASANFDAAAVRLGKSRSPKKPSRTLCKFTRARAKHSLHELLTAHFQAEHADGQLFVDRHIFSNVHGERGFAHARPRRNHDHLGRMQAACHAVEFYKT